MDNIFDKEYMFLDMFQLVLIMKTVLIDLINEVPTIKIVIEEDNYEEEVSYAFGKLDRYYNETSAFRIQYQNKLNFFVNRNIIGDEEIITKIFVDNLDKIKRLSNIEPLMLKRDSLALYKIYKLFYNEEPDFKCEDVRIRAQSMMAILEYYGISLGEEYSFSNDELGYVHSVNLDNLMKNVVLLEEISDNLIDVNLSIHVKEVIKILNEEVNGYLEKSSIDKTDLIEDIASIQYAIVHNMQPSYKKSDLANYLNMPKSLVKSKIKLLKDIDYKMQKQDE